MDYQVLTVGDPNSGKTNILNALIGAKQHVGILAGVTVEKKTGAYSHVGDHFQPMDLLGIYAPDSGNDASSIDGSIASRAVLTYPAEATRWIFSS